MIVEKKEHISCIIPVYNREEMVVECAKSVLAQTWDNYEIILVNDGSTDNTPEVIENLASLHPEQITVVHQDNQGPGAARQTGLDVASGEFIQFLDSDDLIINRKFELCVKAFQARPRPDIVYGITHYYHRDRPDAFTVWKKTGQQIKRILPEFFVSRAWATATPLYRRELLERAGRILPLSCEEDLEFDCRIGLQRPVPCFIDQHLTDVRHHQRGRFSVGNPDRSRQLTDQVKARCHIFSTIREFGLDGNCREMKLFAKGMFLLARQCADAGLSAPAASALDVARAAGTGLDNRDKLAIRFYRYFSCLGGRPGAKLFNRCYDRLHRARVGQDDSQALSG